MSEPKYVNLDTVSIACRMRTGPDNKKSQKSNISYIWVKAPRKDILEIAFSSFQWRFDEIWYITAHLELNGSHVTKHEFFKIQDDWRPLYWKSFFGQNSADDWPILVKFCVGAAVFFYRISAESPSSLQYYFR